jgi:protocatechuate 3,4-dioxygenase beta subunit
MAGAGDGHTSAELMDRLTADVVHRLEAAPDPRLRTVMLALARHLHAFVREVQLTEAELMVGARFLTEVGHTCDAARQEFLLLSDTLGVSSLVDLVQHGSADPRVTAPTILGPFYAPSSPWRDNGASMAAPGEPGQPCVLEGQVRSADGTPLAGAVLDVWQTSAAGYYAVQRPDGLGPDNLRGRYRAGADGSFEIRTVRPVPYSIPDDGPVGRLLGATGRHPMRAAHIHLRVTAESHVPLTTHVFDADSDYLDTDTVFGVKPSLIREFAPDGEGGVRCHFDLVLEPSSVQ